MMINSVVSRQLAFYNKNSRKYKNRCIDYYLIASIHHLCFMFFTDNIFFCVLCNLKIYYFTTSIQILFLYKSCDLILSRFRIKSHQYCYTEALSKTLKCAMNPTHHDTHVLPLLANVHVHVGSSKQLRRDCTCREGRR